MHLETVYKSCREAVGELLHAIERRDLPAMETRLDLLRGYLAVREVSSAGADRSLIERMDALDGLAEEIDAALRRMRAEAAGQMARIQATAPLLLHLAGSEAPSGLTVQ
jgi:hypothetical protein